MRFLLVNQRWIAVPLATLCAVSPTAFAAAKHPVQATPIPQSGLLIAQSKCSLSDLSRSSPPFRCITPAVFRCLKKNNAGNGGSLEYRGDTQGEIVVKSNVAGPVALLGFNFNSSSETLSLSVKKKNFAVQEQQIWDGFKRTLSKCR